MSVSGWRNCCGTSAAPARSFAERINDGRYVDIEWDRGELARAGISMEEAQTAVQNAIGGDNVTTVIQGRAR